MTARIETGCQGGGVGSQPLSVCFFHVSKRAADDFLLESLDERIRELSFLWRVDGKFRQFQGDPVENLIVGRHRDYISVDMLFKREQWEERTVQEFIEEYLLRVNEVPGVLAAHPRAQKLVKEDLLRRELAEYAQRCRVIAAKLDPMEPWPMRTLST
jgi:hypothetical protein